MKTVLTIENPQKWLSNLDSAIAYVYQFVIPLTGDVAYPTDPQLKPDFWGNKPESMEDAGCVLSSEVKHQIIAIVVGLEVGAHLNSNASNFDHKITQVNHLDEYINNLIDALERFGIKQQIYVTTSLAPSNCDLSGNGCGGDIYEAIKLDHGEYSLNNKEQQAKVGNETKIIDFTQIPKALKSISKQEYQGVAPGVLISLYHYWMYSPNIDYSQLSVQEWVTQIQQFYDKLHQAFEIDNLEQLPVSVGEIGWPTSGDNAHDSSPNQPSEQTQLKLLQAVHQWGQTSKNVPYIFIWRLFDVGDGIIAGESPERYYGVYPDSLDKYAGGKNSQPKHNSLPDFK